MIIDIYYLGRHSPGSFPAHGLQQVVPERAGHERVQLLAGVEAVGGEVGVVYLPVRRVEEAQVGEGGLDDDRELVPLVPGY